MSPLEEWAEAQKSGVHSQKPEPETKVVQPQVTPPSSQIEDVEFLIPPPYASRRELDSVESGVFWTTMGGMVWLLLLTLAVVWLFADRYEDPAPSAKKEAAAVKPPEPKVVYKTKHSVKWKTRWKTKTKVVKEIPYEYRKAREDLATANCRIKRLMADNSWRRKLCYSYGDWDACLAYQKGLPFRARVGRTDL